MMIQDKETVEAQAAFIHDVRTRQRGRADDCVRVFAYVWNAPRENLDRLLALLGDDVVLRAPTNPPVTHGKKAARAAFERVFRALPDLRADVIRWNASQDVLFIEMTFHTTIGGRNVSWANVDRFLFEDGVAVERTAFFDSAILRKAYMRDLSSFAQFLRIRFSRR